MLATSGILCSVPLRSYQCYRLICYAPKLQVLYLERDNKYLIKDGKTNTSGHLRLHLKEPHSETHFKAQNPVMQIIFPSPKLSLFLAGMLLEVGFPSRGGPIPVGTGGQWSALLSHCSRPHRLKLSPFTLVLPFRLNVISMGPDQACKDKARD